ncbi:hypothetical protein BH23BAC1_BH23BAC1_48010 [soil metagenome]
MNEKSLVSAIIIFLNGEKYLEEAIESVISQIYQNWELLLVDDGSTDGSTKIAQSFAQKYSTKIKYLEHPGHINRGMSATRNLGIKHAKGMFIGFLDADDVWLPEKLEQQIKIFEDVPECGLVYGRTEIWHSWTNKPKDQDKDYFLELGVEPETVIRPPKIFLLLLENKVQSPTTCNVLIKKEVFDKAGLFQEDFKGMFEDMAFFSKACLWFPIYVSDQCWARYRQHDESCCSVSEKSGRSKKARYPVLNWLEKYLNKEKVYSPKIRIALYKEIFPFRHEFLFRLFKNPGKITGRYLKKYFSGLSNAKDIKY